MTRLNLTLLLFCHSLHINGSDHIEIMELLHFLLDGRQSSVAKHLHAFIYAILSKNDMVDEVGYFIYLFVE